MKTSERCSSQVNWFSITAKLAMLVAFAGAFLFSSVSSAQGSCTNKFGVNALRAYDAGTNKTTFTFTVNRLPGAEHALSHWGFPIDLCDGGGSVPAILAGGVFQTSLNNTNWSSAAWVFQADPSTDESCNSGTVLKFDVGMGSETVRYYRMILNGNIRLSIPFFYVKFGQICCTSTINYSSCCPPVTADAGTTPAAQCYNAAGNTFNLSGTGSNGTPAWTIHSNPQNLGVNISGGSTYTPSVALSGGNGSVTLRLTVSNANQECDPASSDVTVVVNNLPGAPTAVDNSRCGTGTVSLSATGCTGTYKWYNAASGGTLLHTGQNFTTPSISSTTSYWVSCTSALGCEGPRTEVVATVKPVPTTTASNNGPACVGQSFSVSASNSLVGANYSWTGPNGFTSLVQNPPAFTNATAAMAGTYTVTVSLNNCSSTSSTDVVINNLPGAPTAVDNSRCGTGTVSLSATGCTGTYTWYSAASGGTLLHTGQNFTTPSISSTTSYWVSCTSALGCEGPRTEVVATVKPVPTTTASNNGPACVGQSFSVSASNSLMGASFSWTGPNGFTSLVQNPPAFTNATAAMAGTYTVTVSLNNCSSTSSTDVVINNLPGAPTAVDNSRCGTGTVALSATGCTGTYKWYSAASGGTLLHTGQNFTTPSISSTTSYWVSCTSALGCEGPRTEVVATVKPVPTTTASNNGPACVGQSFSVSASNSLMGASFSWTGPNGFTSLVQNPPAFTNATAAMAGTYTVTVSLNNCSSTSSTDVVINNLPGAPTAVDNSRCGSGTVALSATGCTGTYKWYSAASGGTLLHTGQNFTTPSISSTTSYWVSCTSALGCEGPRTEVVATVKPVPTTTASNNGPACVGQSFSVSASNSLMGASFSWTGPNGFTSLVQNPPAFTNATAAMAGTYTVTVSLNNCSSTSSTDVVINNLPGAPTAVDNSRCGTGTVSLSATGCTGTYKWYSAASGGTLLHTGQNFTTPSISSTTSYWVSCTSALGCEGPRTEVVATIANVPMMMSPSAMNYCEADPSLGSVRIANSQMNVNYRLFNDDNVPMGAAVPGTGAAITWNNLPEDGYFVQASNASGLACMVPSATVFVLARPYLPVIVDSKEVCIDGTVTLTGNIIGGSGATGVWAGLGAAAGAVSGNTFNAEGLPPGIYTVTYTFDNDGCTSFEEGTVTVKHCFQVYGTYSQGYYSNKNGNSCDGVGQQQNPTSMISHLLSNGFIKVGGLNRSITIPVNAAQTLNAIMPGGGTANKLVFNGHLNISTSTGDFKNNYLTKQGRINNILISQTIAVKLAHRLSTVGAFPIRINTVDASQDAWFETAKTNGCPATAYETYSSNCSASIYYIKASVAKYLTQGGNVEADVNNLLALADELLNGELLPGTMVNNYPVPSYSDVTDVLASIISAFDGWRSWNGAYQSGGTCPAMPAMSSDVIVFRSADPAPTAHVKSLEVAAYPNPFKDAVRFTIASPVSGQAQLEVYNMMGQKVVTLFNRHVQANQPQVVEHRFSTGAQQNLIYIFRVGDQQVTGKLMNIK